MKYALFLYLIFLPGKYVGDLKIAFLRLNRQFVFTLWIDAKQKEISLGHDHYRLSALGQSLYELRFCFTRLSHYKNLWLWINRFLFGLLT